MRRHVETDVVVDQLLFVGIEGLALAHLSDAGALVVGRGRPRTIFTIPPFKQGGFDAGAALVGFVTELQSHLFRERREADRGGHRWREHGDKNLQEARRVGPEIAAPLDVDDGVVATLDGLPRCWPK
jgi:hypothetical protein